MTLGRTILFENGVLIKIIQPKKDYFMLKKLDHSQNNFEGLILLGFVPKELTLTYTTGNLKNLSKLFDSNQCIDDNR